MVRRSTGEQPTLAGRRGAGEARGSGAGPPDRFSALRDQLPQGRQLHLVTLAVVAIVLLAVLPAVFLLKDSAQDPVFAGLDQLNLPAWAVQGHNDQAAGNRWCVGTCRLRERTWRSAKGARDTAPTYEQALTDAGWLRWQTAGCPKPDTGSYSCWQRDEYVLDLWVRDAPCDVTNVPGAPASGGAPGGPSAAPLPTPTGSEPPPTCGGSLVTAKVGNGVDPHWHK
jgi:integrin beta 3